MAKHTDKLITEQGLEAVAVTYIIIDFKHFSCDLTVPDNTNVAHCVPVRQRERAREGKRPSQQLISNKLENKQDKQRLR